ncbi:hypothetical protein VQ042_16365 [Aurantimonas sp. A2-1-M11]|uniref:hypothetical protein n=1 Tax=Aurantimonas sp. A2-1-M11 TaxID=3113712 RepID=UPI002F9524DE
MASENDTQNERHGRPWPRFMDYVFDANMIDGTVRMVGLILVFAIVFGTLFWLLQ